MQPVTGEEVQRHLLSINSTAVGHDGVCSRMISLILPEFLPILTHLFNYSISISVYPSAWKKAHIVPLSKINKPTSLTHYRPISILPFLSKVLEHIVHEQLSRYLLTNCLLNPWQSGFRSGHSTVTALLKVSEDIRFAMENRNLTVVVLLDFSNAFNSVDFDILLSILRSLNISSSACSWFDSYLRDRSQCVCLSESYSNWCTLKTGVPQGGVLSPLLFSIFINTITSVISSNFHLYADDLQLYRHFSVADVTAAIAHINEDLNRISYWAECFGLVVNPTKSQALVVGSRYMHSCLSTYNIPIVTYNGVPINYVDTVKNLGLHFSHDLSWSKHISEISKKVHYSFHSLKNLQYFLPIKTKTVLVQSLLLPLLDYADACYLDATEEQVNKLERLQNSCIRFIFGLRKFDHVSKFRTELKWLPIRLRRQTHILCLLYNILFNPLSPNYLRERFVFLHPPGSSCRSNVQLLLRIPSHSSGFYTNSYTVHAARLWNSLPSSIRTCTTLYTFKKKLKEHYLSIS